MEPEVGMRIDFEVRGSDAADIYPVPDASSTPPVQPPAPAPPPPTGGSPPAQPGATPSPDERFKETLGGLHTRLDDRYQPIRERIGNYGVIGVGVALIVVGALIRFGIFEGILDLIATVGILVSVVVTAVGVFMLGKDEGWWERSAPPSPADAPGRNRWALLSTRPVPRPPLPIRAQRPRCLKTRRAKPPGLLNTRPARRLIRAEGRFRRLLHLLHLLRPLRLRVSSTQFRARSQRRASDL